MEQLKLKRRKEQMRLDKDVENMKAELRKVCEYGDYVRDIDEFEFYTHL